jgi:anti-sigma B factor antagonist
MPEPPDRLITFALDVRFDGARAVVAVAGELDIAAVAPVNSAFGELRSVGWPEIIADLRGLTFIDSEGLQLLVRLEIDARENGWSFAIVDGAPAVRRLLALTNLTAYFTHADAPPHLPPPSHALPRAT